MRDFFRSPLFRCLVCLILVCCILVNVSPIRAEALPISTWVWLEASMVFASIMSGLGISPIDELAEGFCNTCNDCWDFVSLNYDFVTDDEKIAVWATGTDELPFMVDQELIEAVRDWLFSSETIKEESADIGMAYYNNWYFADISSILEDNSDCPYAFIKYLPSSDSFELNLFPSVGETYEKNDFYYIPNEFNGFCYRLFLNSDQTSSASCVYAGAQNFNREYFIAWSNFDIYLPDGSLYLAASEPSDSLVISADDEKYLLNYVASSSEDFSTGYSTWTAGAISVPGIRSKEEEKEVVVPLSIPGTAADVYSFAQTDVWTGANTAADVIAQAVPITGTDTPTPDLPVTPEVPENLQAYTFDLRDFFPFCIPFDLYDFFSVLDAPPEAPQFHWELRDLSGNTYPIDIDLSAWDNLASFFRKLQLFLFITGLAAASRKYIKW